MKYKQMKLPNQPKVLAATYNPVSKTKMFSVMVDFPTVLLAELRTHRIITQRSSYEHSEIIDISCSANSARAIPHKKYVERVLENPFIPVWTEQQKGMSGEGLSEEKIKVANQLWLDNLKERESVGFMAWKDEYGYFNSLDKSKKPNKKDYDLTNPEELEEYNEELRYYRDNVKRCNDNGGEGVDYELETLKSKYDELIAEGVHKQNANRLLAPFAYTTCILTGTEWSNFFSLRCPKYTFQTSWGNKVYNSKKEALAENPPLKKGNNSSDHTHRCNDFTEKNWQEVNESGAQPEFQIIAEMIYDLYHEAKFQENKYHIPFEKDIRNAYSTDIKKKIGVVDFAGSAEQAEAYYDEKVIDYVMLVSASMAAKLSYDTQEKEDTLEKHLERAQLLKTHKHAEPFSHQAIAMDSTQYEVFAKRFVTTKPNWEQQKDCGILTTRTHIVEELGWCYNNRGFITQRYLIENLQ